MNINNICFDTSQVDSFDDVNFFMRNSWFLQIEKCKNEEYCNQNQEKIS